MISYILLIKLIKICSGTGNIGNIIVRSQEPHCSFLLVTLAVADCQPSSVCCSTLTEPYSIPSTLVILMCPQSMRPASLEIFFIWSSYNNISELNQVFSLTSNILGNKIEFINAPRNCSEKMLLLLNFGCFKYSLVPRAMFIIFIIVIIIIITIVIIIMVLQSRIIVILLWYILKLFK